MQMDRSNFDALSVRRKIWYTIQRFCATTTAHGLPRVITSERRPVRKMWLIIFVLALIVLILHGGMLVSSYLKFPINTLIAYQGESFIFPEVTICNLVPFSLLEFERKFGGNSIDNHEEREQMMEEAKTKAYNMILYCSYNKNKSCSYKDFRVIEDPTLGQCFKFVPYTRKLTSSSSDFGLNMVLFSESKHDHDIAVDEELQESSQSSGVRIIIHDLDTHPHPEYRGIDIGTGVNALIGLTIETAEMIPRNQCYTEERDYYFCDLHERTIRSYRYAPEDCQTFRMQKVMVERCGCLSPKFDVPAEFCFEGSEVLRELGLNSSQVHHCTDESRSCHDYTKDEINRNYLKLVANHCKQPCNQRVWKSEVSLGNWPSFIAKQHIMKNLRKCHSHLSRLPLTPSLSELIKESNYTFDKIFEKNLLRVSVYATSLAGNRIVENLAYPLGSLIGEIGGIMGLWLGCSVLTVLFEPLELLLNILLLLFDRRKSKVQVDENPI